METPLKPREYKRAHFVCHGKVRAWRMAGGDESLPTPRNAAPAAAPVPQPAAGVHAQTPSTRGPGASSDTMKAPPPNITERGRRRCRVVRAPRAAAYSRAFAVRRITRAVRQCRVRAARTQRHAALRRRMRTAIRAHGAVRRRAAPPSPQAPPVSVRAARALSAALLLIPITPTLPLCAAGMLWYHPAVAVRYGASATPTQSLSALAPDRHVAAERGATPLRTAAGDGGQAKDGERDEDDADEMGSENAKGPRVQEK